VIRHPCVLELAIPSYHSLPAFIDAAVLRNLLREVKGEVDSHGLGKEHAIGDARKLGR
jgi:hypothetical protein